MIARPILFSAPMVRALLAGTKTQTRRILKGAYIDGPWSVRKALNPRFEAHTHDWWLGDAAAPASAIKCPYGQPGDLLWVRETTIRVEEHGYKGPVYAASDNGVAMLDWGIGPAPDDVCDVEPEDVRLRPSIHMPRAYSRLTLRITDVRVERLQEISEEDAKAEGVWAGQVFPPESMADREVLRWRPETTTATAREAFWSLWESINGLGSWEANPWVWALTFEVIKANVDQVLAQEAAA